MLYIQWCWCWGLVSQVFFQPADSVDNDDHCFQETPIASTPMSWSDAIGKPPNGPSEGRQEGEGRVFGLDDLCRFGEILKQIFKHGCDVHVCNVVVCYVMSHAMACHVMQWHVMSCHLPMCVCVCLWCAWLFVRTYVFFSWVCLKDTHSNACNMYHLQMFVYFNRIYKLYPPAPQLPWFFWSVGGIIIPDTQPNRPFTTKYFMW